MDINKNIGDMLRNLRTRHNLSVKRMAELVHMDDHTWSRYESGRSSPSISDLVLIFRAMGENPFPYILQALYPRTYDFSKSNDRDMVVDFFSNVASDKDISQLSYLIKAPHGSNPSAQLSMFAMIDHLPLRSRVVIAELVDALWQLADMRGELIGQEHMPDVEIFRKGLKHAVSATADKRDSYIIDKE